jgi:hypothetical protein
MAQPRSSIGVELEFLLAWTTADKVRFRTPACFEKSNGCPMVLPTNTRPNQRSTVIRSRLEATIAKALENHRGDRVIENDDDVLRDRNAYHLRSYRDWKADEDASVCLPPVLDGDLGGEHFNDYQYHPVEIRSPALWATDASFEEIRLVVQALAGEYWILTPPSAGLHFHYGNGKDYIPLQNLRRMAAFLIATDPILVQLHPESRRDNDYCLSNRLHSRVAYGLPAATAARGIGAQDVEEEAEFPGAFDRRNRNPRADPGPLPRERGRRRRVMFARGDLTGYGVFRPGFPDFLPDPPPRDFRPLDIPFAVREILRCLNAPTVAQLMQATEIDRPAYSFISYVVANYKRPRMTAARVARQQAKRTVEFRQQASTMVPEEVVARGRLAVRLCEFAATADLEELWKIVLDCTTGEVSGRWYDVFDLLAELDLNKETKVLQRAVARFRGEEVPAEFDKDDDEKVVPEVNARSRTWLDLLPRWLRSLISRNRA